MYLGCAVLLVIFNLVSSKPNPEVNVNFDLQQIENVGEININVIEKLVQKKEGPSCNNSEKDDEPDELLHVEKLATHELWLHILLQMDRPYEDRRTTYKGDKNYVYYLDNEIFEPDERSTPINITTIDDFTTGKERFKKLLNYQKGRGIIPSTFEPDVKVALAELHAVYKENPGAKGILKVAVNSKDHVNEYLHMLTLMHAIVYDEELSGYGRPAFYDVFAELFTTGCNSPQKNGCCRIDEYLQNLSEDEWRISYYREDAGLNNFHGSWHFYNPWNSDGVPLRHGELFFYFHNQLMARYNMERLSNGLDAVIALDNWNCSYLIPQNYFPPLLKNTLGRCPNKSAGPLGMNLHIYRTNFQNAISKNQLQKADGSFVNLKNNDGIKYVGCALERAWCGDLKYDQYGGDAGIHNTGHVTISKIGRIGCQSGPSDKSGVMLDTWSAVRDPIFFRWHTFIDDVFQSHKRNLPQYNLTQLDLNGVNILRASVYSTPGDGERLLYTFNSRLKMTMWFNGTSSTCIHQPTINHYPFTYYFIIMNNNPAPIDVNIRIFMGPKTNPPLPYEELRTRWVLMDRFNHTLESGANSIARDSCSSSVTVPPAKSIQELHDIYKDEKSFNEFISKPKKCQCGLPEHLLLPRGTSEGMPYQLFFYITPRNTRQNQSQYCPNQECGDLCSRDYTRCMQSDDEPMGFPFDRPLHNLAGTPINTIEDLNNTLPNAMLHDITIIHTDKYIDYRQCNN